jgi:hypothetical protein
MVSTLENIKTILQRYDGLESNIPVNHPYWKLVSLYRAGVLDAPEEPFKLDPLYPPPPLPEVYESVKHSLLRVKIQNILISFGGRESNIPYTNEYWFLQNQLKAFDRLEAQQ